MTNGLLPKNTLVVVGTGEGATLFRNVAVGGGIELKAAGSLEPGDLADQGPAGKSPPDTSPKESMEATFAKILANHLYDLAQAHKFEKLVLILDPDTLGEIRPSLHVSVQDKIVLELAKTLVNNPITEIERAIKTAL